MDVTPTKIPEDICDGSVCKRSEEERLKDFNEGKKYCKIDGGELVFESNNPKPVEENKPEEPNPPIVKPKWWKKRKAWLLTLVGIFLLSLGLIGIDATNNFQFINSLFNNEQRCAKEEVKKELTDALSLLVNEDLLPEQRESLVNPIMDTFFKCDSTVKVLYDSQTLEGEQAIKIWLQTLAEEKNIESIEVTTAETNEICQFSFLELSKKMFESEE